MFLPHKGFIQAAMAINSTTATTIVTTCHALLRDLIGTKVHACTLRLRNQCSFLPASGATTPSVLLSVLAVFLLCTTALSSVVIFFLPLLVSTSICCGAAYLLVASERPEGGATAAKEVVLLCGAGSKAEVGLLQVYGGANASAYGGRQDVQVGYFLMRRGPGCSAGDGGWTKRGVDEDVVFAGRLLSAAGGGAALEEELVALQVDRFAECVWDSYFGGCSRWNNYDT